MTKVITSLDNALIKKALKYQNPRNRDQLQRCLVEGIRAVETFLSSPYKLNRLYVTKKNIPWAKEHCQEEAIVEITDQLMQKLSATVSPSGIIGLFDLPPTRPLNELTAGIVLANIQDPGNMGTLIRTATALNQSIVLIDGVNPYNQKVIQSTAGSLAHARLFITTWDELRAHKKSLSLAGLVVEGGTPIQQVNPSTPRLLVVGNEAHGIPRKWEDQCDEKITLPMPGNTESLNAAVAGSIALYSLYVKD